MDATQWPTVRPFIEWLSVRILYSQLKKSQISEVTLYFSSVAIFQHWKFAQEHIFCPNRFKMLPNTKLHSEISPNRVTLLLSRANNKTYTAWLEDNLL